MSFVNGSPLHVIDTFVSHLEDGEELEFGFNGKNFGAQFTLTDDGKACTKYELWGQGSTSCTLMAHESPMPFRQCVLGIMNELVYEHGSSSLQKEFEAGIAATPELSALWETSGFKGD